MTGIIIKSKEAEIVAKALLDSWCLMGLGYPSKCFHVDNGNEFKKNTLEAISKKTGTKVQVTASYSAWSNGTIERKHATVDQTIKKLMTDDTKVSLDDALKHSLWAKNMEIGRHGYSPFQILLGKSPFILGVSSH